jgi:hypothetical protein
LCEIHVVARDVEKRVKERKLLTQEDDTRVLQENVKHAEELQERINSGLEFKNLDDHIKKLTVAFLKVIFAPFKLELQFADGPPPTNSLSLVEFLADRDKKLATKIEELELKKKQLKEPEQIAFDDDRRI